MYYKYKYLYAWLYVCMNVCKYFLYVCTVCESRPQESDYSMGSSSDSLTSIEKAATTTLSSSPRGGVNVEHIFLGDGSNLAEDNNIITSSGSGGGGDNNLDTHSTTSQSLPSKTTLIAYIHIHTYIYIHIHAYI